MKHMAARIAALGGLLALLSLSACGSDYRPLQPGAAGYQHATYGYVVAYRADQLSRIVNIGPGTAPETFTFSHNWWYCIDRPDHAVRPLLPVEEQGGRYGVDPQFADPERGDLRLRGNDHTGQWGRRDQ